MFGKTKLLSDTIKYHFQQKNLLKFKQNIRHFSNYIITSGLEDIEIPNVSIPELIKSQTEKFTHLTAAECGITGRKLTYPDLHRKSTNLAKSLRKKLNLQEGDVIGVLLPNIPEYTVIILGILEAGLILTPLNPVSTPEEIGRQLKDSSAKAVITLTNFWQIAKSCEQLLERCLPILTIKTQRDESLPGGAIDFNEFTDNGHVDYENLQPRKPSDIAILPYSSGTTGLPKGVELTHSNIVANLCQIISPEMNIMQGATASHQNVSPAILPIFHIFGNMAILSSLYNGAKSVMLPKFLPELYVDVLQKHKADTLFVVPPIMLFLTNHPMVKKDHLQWIRTMFSGAAPLGQLDEQKFLEKADKHVNVLQGYGLTETSPTVSITSIKLKQSLQTIRGSVGRPIPNTTCKIIDIETGEDVGPNTTGELLVKGPQVMKRYHNRPKDTEEAFLNGWLRTGDMAYYSNDNNVIYITDRLKELIKVKGFQVPPAELEEIIRDYPAVEDVGVIGIPHSSDGEVPRAYIVPKQHSTINVDKLKEFVASKVVKYKQLNGGVVIVDSIPKNLSGKILRRQLKLQYQQENRK